MNELIDKIINTFGNGTELQTETTNVTRSLKLSPDGTFNLLPRGAIVIWTKEIIPEGWTICDGTNGTPDLRNKFVRGKGTQTTIPDTGGNEKIKLKVKNLPEHNHELDNHVRPEEWKTQRDPQKQRIVGMASNRADNYDYAGAPNTVQRTTDINTKNDSYGYGSSTQQSREFSILPPYMTLYFIMKL